MLPRVSAVERVESDAGVHSNSPRLGIANQRGKKLSFHVRMSRSNDTRLLGLRVIGLHRDVGESDLGVPRKFEWPVTVNAEIETVDLMQEAPVDKPSPLFLAPKLSSKSEIDVAIKIIFSRPAIDPGLK